jgi:hypothetical protein
MDGDRNERALQRIDAALARIEGAARQRPTGSATSTGDPELAERHARLREAVGQSLRQLDALIGEQQQ